MIYVGIDAGSRAIKIVLFDGGKMEILDNALVSQGVDQAHIALELFKKVLKNNDLSPKDIGRVIATGYGRGALEWADSAVTEITCHAAGVKYQAEGARTVIDIGGQDNKLIRLDQNGSVRDFSMNDRCAAGTGRFLEVVAERLEIRLEDLGSLVAKAQKPAAISSMCVVFAETEIISLLASGELPENIAAGVEDSIAKRLAAMAGGKTQDEVIFTGGAALVPGMKEALSKALNCEVVVAEKPQFTGALGAALIAAKDNMDIKGKKYAGKNVGTFCEVKI